MSYKEQFTQMLKKAIIGYAVGAGISVVILAISGYRAGFWNMFEGFLAIWILIGSIIAAIMVSKGKTQTVTSLSQKILHAAYKTFFASLFPDSFSAIGIGLLVVKLAIGIVIIVPLLLYLALAFPSNLIYFGIMAALEKKGKLESKETLCNVLDKVSAIFPIILGLLLYIMIKSIGSLSSSPSYSNDSSTVSEKATVEESSEEVSEAVDESKTEVVEENATDESILPEPISAEKIAAIDEENLKDPYFFSYYVNMDEDEDLEEVVVKVTPNTNPNSVEQEVSTTSIVDFTGDFPNIIYTDSVNSRYSLIYGDDNVNSLIFSTLPAYTYGYDGEVKYYNVSLKNGEVIEEEISQEKYVELSVGAINIDDTGKYRYGNTVPRIGEDDPECRNYTADAFIKLVENAKQKNNRISDARFVTDGGKKYLFATLLPKQADVIREYEYGTNYVDSYAEVVCVDENNKLDVVDTIDLVDPNDEYGDYDIEIDGYGKYCFGETEQYYVSIYGIDFGVQYKYGIINNTATLIDDSMEFLTNADGVFCKNYVNWGEWQSACEYVEVTYEKGAYKQYASIEISEDEISSVASNWLEERDKCIADAQATEFVVLNEYEGTAVTVANVNLSSIMRGSNGKYYITCSYDAVDQYTGESYSPHVYYTYHLDGNELVREELVMECVAKTETSALPLEVIY